MEDENVPGPQAMQEDEAVELEKNPRGHDVQPVLLTGGVALVDGTGENVPCRHVSHLVTPSLLE